MILGFSEFFRSQFSAQLNSQVKQLRDVLLPVSCLGCGAWDQQICDRCAALAESGLRESFLAREFGSCAWYMCEYMGSARNLVLSAKHSSRLRLDVFFETAGYNCAKSLVEFYHAGRLPVPNREVWVIPAPSHRPIRGGRPSVCDCFASGMARGLLHLPGVTSVRSVRAISLVPGAVSQGGLGRMERLDNRAGKMFVQVKDLESLCQRTVFLVDDVCTTGATIREMARVIAPFECSQLGIVTFAQAKPLNSLQQ